MSMRGRCNALRVGRWRLKAFLIYTALARQKHTRRCDADHMRAESGTAAARAASAYRAAAIKTHDTPPPEIHEHPLYASSKISAVHKLITDLSRLSATGIEELTIERGETFLDSLVTAVKNAQR